MERTEESGETDAPLPQRAIDRIWLLAAAAFLFWLLSYVVWGLLDIAAVPAG